MTTQSCKKARWEITEILHMALSAFKNNLSSENQKQSSYSQNQVYEFQGEYTFPDTLDRLKAAEMSACWGDGWQTPFHLRQYRKGTGLSVGLILSLSVLFLSRDGERMNAKDLGGGDISLMASCGCIVLQRPFPLYLTLISTFLCAVLKCLDSFP